MKRIIGSLVLTLTLTTVAQASPESCKMSLLQASLDSVALEVVKASPGQMPSVKQQQAMAEYLDNTAVAAERFCRKILKVNRNSRF